MRPISRGTDPPDQATSTLSIAVVALVPLSIGAVALFATHSIVSVAFFATDPIGLLALRVALLVTPGTRRLSLLLMTIVLGIALRFVAGVLGEPLLTLTLPVCILLLSVHGSILPSAWFRANGHEPSGDNDAGLRWRRC